MIGCGPTQAWQAISLAVALHQPERARLRVEVRGDHRERALERGLDVHRDGEVLGHLGEQGEGAGEIAAPQRGVLGLDSAGLGSGGQVAVIRRGVDGVVCDGIGQVRLETVAVR